MRLIAAKKEKVIQNDKMRIIEAQKEKIPVNTLRRSQICAGASLRADFLKEALESPGNNLRCGSLWTGDVALKEAEAEKEEEEEEEEEETGRSSARARSMRIGRNVKT